MQKNHNFNNFYETLTFCPKPTRIFCLLCTYKKDKSYLQKARCCGKIYKMPRVLKTAAQFSPLDQDKGKQRTIK